MTGIRGVSLIAGTPEQCDQAGNLLWTGCAIGRHSGLTNERGPNMTLG
jgi:hypothetical protein